MEEVKRKPRGEPSAWTTEGQGPSRALGRAPGFQKVLDVGGVPYAAAQLAPAEFGLRVAAGAADEFDLISFPPAALRLGLHLLCP